MKALLDRNRLTWVLRALWLVAGFFGTASDFTDRFAYPLALDAVLFVAWIIGLTAALTPIPLTLVVIRTVMPAFALLTAWPLIRGDLTGAGAAAFVLASLAAVIALSAPIGDRFADGASYGDERRMLLRPPPSVLLGPLPLAWLAVTAGVLVGFVFLANGRWVAATVALAIGLPLAFFGFRSLFSLAQRWVVFVPTGLVIHDLVNLVDPVLFPRDAVRFVGPALADTTATDVSAGATGLLVELNLLAPTEVPIRDKAGPNVVVSAPVELDALLFAPSLPGEALEEAGRRKLPVH